VVGVATIVLLRSLVDAIGRVERLHPVCDLHGRRHHRLRDDRAVAYPGAGIKFVAYGVDHDKFRVLDFSLTLSFPYTFWAGMLGGMFLTLGTHGTDQNDGAALPVGA